MQTKKTDRFKIFSARNILSAGFLFFVFFYFYIWLRINPRLLYYRNPRLFLFDTGFLKSFLCYPGGAVDYVWRLFLELSYFSYLGAFVIIVVAFFICLNFSRFVQTVSTEYRRLLFFTPAFFIFLVCNQYNLVLLFGLLIALVFVNIYTALIRRLSSRGNSSPDLVNLSVYLVLSFLLYYLAVYFYWFFAIMCASWEIIRNRRYALGCLYLVVEILIYYFHAVYILYLTGSGIFYFLFPFFHPDNLVLRLIVLALPVVLFLIAAFKAKSKRCAFAVFALLTGIFQFRAETLSGRILYVFFLVVPVILVLPHAGYKDRLLSLFKRANRAFRLLPVVLLALVLVVTFDGDMNSFLKINYFSRMKMWREALVEADSLSQNTYERHPQLYEMVFKALYYTGRLPYEQFKYPANLSLNIPSPRPTKPAIEYIDPARTSDTYLNLGLVNYSELMSYWCLEKVKDSAVAYKQLALIYILKDNDKAARVVLKRLKKTFHYNRWARRYLRLLDGSVLPAGDSDLARINSVMIKADDVGDEELLMRLTNDSGYDYEGVFSRLLDENKDNKMAFEYLMSYYLLTGQIEKVIDNLPLLDNYGYAGMPYHYQEAVLIKLLEDRDADQGFYAREIDSSLAERNAYFARVCRQNNYDKNAVYDALKDSYAGSYFLYYLRLNKDTTIGAGKEKESNSED